MAQVEITQSVKASHLANSADEDAAPSFAECSAGGGASIASSRSGIDGGDADASSGGALAIDDAGTATIASRPTRGRALNSSATRPPQNDEWGQR